MAQACAQRTIDTVCAIDCARNVCLITNDDPLKTLVESQFLRFAKIWRDATRIRGAKSADVAGTGSQEHNR
jgi:hypothetical protein